MSRFCLRGFHRGLCRIILSSTVVSRRSNREAGKSRNTLYVPTDYSDMQPLTQKPSKMLPYIHPLCQLCSTLFKYDKKSSGKTEVRPRLFLTESEGSLHRLFWICAVTCLLRVSHSLTWVMPLNNLSDWSACTDKIGKPFQPERLRDLWRHAKIGQGVCLRILHMSSQQTGRQAEKVSTLFSVQRYYSLPNFVARLLEVWEKSAMILVGRTVMCSWHLSL